MGWRFVLKRSSSSGMTTSRVIPSINVLALSKDINKLATLSVADVAISSNTAGFLGLVNVPTTITVNKLSINVTAVGTEGIFDIVLYAEDGQAQIISITTASIAGAGLITTAVSALVLSSGNYYIFITPH